MQANGVGPQSVELFTQGGGPAQQRWSNVRLYLERVSGTGDCTGTVKIDGSDAPTPDGELQVKVNEADPAQSDSADLLLTTGQLVTVDVQCPAGFSWKLDANTSTLASEI
jgi:hypothetical protein